MACWNWRCVKDEKRGRGSEVYSGLLGGVFNMEINNVTEMGSSTLSKGLGTVWGWGTHLVAFCISKNFLLDLKFIEGDEKCSDPLTRPPFSLSLSLMFMLFIVFFLETTRQASISSRSARSPTLPDAVLLLSSSQLSSFKPPFFFCFNGTF